MARLAVASAQPSESAASASLELDAAPNCVTREDLIARVRARSPRVRFVVDGTGLVIRVRISEAPSGTVTGEITLANPGTKASTRHVPARSCGEAADAVALIIAVTLDPTSADRGPNPSATSRETASSGTGKDAGDEQPRNEPSWNAAAKPALSGVATDAPVTSGSDATSRSRSRAGVAANVAMEGVVGVAPGVMPAVALFASVGIDRPSIWAPSLVLGVHHAWRSDFQAPGGSASFALDAATLDVCPLRFRRSVFEVRPCASALLGSFSAHGSDTVNPSAESGRPFWVVGAAGIVTADLPWLLQASARLAIGANLVRDSFEFAPTTFHEVPAVSATGSLGVGLRWP